MAALDINGFRRNFGQRKLTSWNRVTASCFRAADPLFWQAIIVIGMISSPVMDVSENTPVGDVRRAVANNAFPIPGDAVKVALAMIDSVETDPAPCACLSGATPILWCGAPCSNALLLSMLRKTSRFPR